MRLLNVKSFKLESFEDVKSAPPYAILSHRWGKREIVFEDLRELPNSHDVAALEDRILHLELLLKQRLLRSGDYPHGTGSLEELQDSRLDRARSKKG
jgi:hypothetical protein